MPFYDNGDVRIRYENTGTGTGTGFSCCSSRAGG